MVGQNVSHYRVVESLGAGGMGVVYKAEDLRLARAVALKFLAPERTHDRTMIERFLREARTASALNHPNICTIYEIDEHEGLQFIAMELLEGEPLDRRIGGRPLGITAAIDYAMQIADALDVAHGQSILHRDIKPANIFITTRGQAKVLDFGLAKLMEPQGAEYRSVGMTRAVTDVLTTKQGTALGTIAYMSPEQARGEDLDARTDIFSFGLVLYEMVTGHRTFEGNTTAVVFDAILNREPRAPIELNANVPVALERIIAACLQKDRNRRYASASDIRMELEQVRRNRESGVTSSKPVSGIYAPGPTGTTWPSGTVPVATAPTPSARKTSAARYGSIAIAAVGLVALVGAALLFHQSGQEPAPPAVDTTTEAATPVDESVGTTGPLASAGVTPAAPMVTTPTPAAAVTPPPPPAARGKAPGIPVPPATATPATGSAELAVDPAAARGAKPGADPNIEALKTARAKFEAKLYDQALTDLQAIVTRPVASAATADAFLLIGSIHERRNRPDDAMAAYVELRSKFPTSAAAAEATFLNAELLLRSRRSDRERSALDLFASIPTTHPSSPLAPFALAKQATLEQRLRMRVPDEQMGKVVPAELISYRSLVTKYPTAPAAESAFASLADLYESQKRYDLAAAALFDLATRFPANRVDAAWRAGEMYEDRVKDRERARDSYALVPAESSRYRDAQRKLQARS